MSRTLRIASLLLIALLLAPGGLTAAPPTSNLAPRVAALEAQVASLTDRVETLEILLAATPTPVATPTPTPTPVATPTPTPVTTPVPTPTPAGRPFAAPVTTQTVVVPATIDTTGQVDVAAALQTFVNNTPDGSTIRFQPGAIYSVSAGVRLDGRHNVIFDGQGATIRSSGPGWNVMSSPFALTDRSTDLVIRNFILEGSNNRTGFDLYDGSTENQMGIASYGNTRVEITGNIIRKVHGDGIYTNDSGPTHIWPLDIWVHHNTFERIGRNALTINSGRRVLIEDNLIDDIGGSVLDIEPDIDEQGVDGLILRNNTIGSWGWAPQYTMHFVACANQSAAPGASVDNVTITGNVVTEGPPGTVNTPANMGGLASWIGRPARMSNIVFTNNTTTSTGRGPVLIFSGIDGLTVTGNVQPLVSGSLASITDSTSVVYQP